MNWLWFIVPSCVGLCCGAMAYRYARRRILEAERLAKEGWVMVGFSFVTGPIMVPPLVPPEFADRIREVYRQRLLERRS